MQDNIKAFIERGLDSEPKKLRSSLFLVNFFPLLGIAYGLILKGFYLVFSLMIGLSIVTAFVLIVFLTRKNKAINTIVANICLYISTTINYLLFAMITYSMDDEVHLSMLFLLIPEIVVAVFTFSIIPRIIKKQNGKSPKQRNISIGTVSGITAVSTYVLLKRLNVDIAQNTALLICTWLLVILSCLFVVMACYNVIKYYYSKKHHIDGI